MKLLSPDKIVDSILHSVAYESLKGCSINKIWEIVDELFQEYSDDALKNLIWIWLSKETSRCEVLVNNVRVEPYLQLSQMHEHYGNDFVIRLTRDFQWVVLTGQDFEAASFITDKLFLIILVVAQSKEKGIMPMHIAKATKQDNRCLGSRLNKLIKLNIVSKFFLATHPYPLIVHKDFKDKVLEKNKNNKTKKTKGRELDPNVLRRKVVQLVKQGENQLRGLLDLKRQLGFTSSGASKRFNRTIKQLVAHNYLEKVFAKINDGNRMFVSLSYVKDYPADASFDSEDEDEDDDEDEDEDEDDEDEDEEEVGDEADSKKTSKAKIEEPIDIDGYASLTETPAVDFPTLKSENEILVADAIEDEQLVALYNGLVPLGSQAMSHIRNSKDGINSLELVRLMFGSNNTKKLSDFFQELMRNDSSDPRPILKDTNIKNYYVDYAALGGYIFSGKVKLMQYISYVKAIEKSPKFVVPSKFLFYSDKVTKVYTPPFELSTLESMTSFGLVNTMKLYEDEFTGEKRVLFRGAGAVPERFKQVMPTFEPFQLKSVLVKKGRPRKNPVLDEQGNKVERRGRPRKTPRPEETGEPKIPKRKGRPKGSVKVKRGRPKKSATKVPPPIVDDDSIFTNAGEAGAWNGNEAVSIVEDEPVPIPEEPASAAKEPATEEPNSIDEEILIVPTDDAPTATVNEAPVTIDAETPNDVSGETPIIIDGGPKYSTVDESLNSTDSKASTPASIEAPVKRRRGRPRKNPVAAKDPAAFNIMSALTKISEKQSLSRKTTPEPGTGAIESKKESTSERTAALTRPGRSLKRGKAKEQGGESAPPIAKRLRLSRRLAEKNAGIYVDDKDFDFVGAANEDSPAATNISIGKTKNDDTAEQVSAITTKSQELLEELEEEKEEIVHILEEGKNGLHQNSKISRNLNNPDETQEIGNGKQVQRTPNRLSEKLHPFPRSGSFGSDISLPVRGLGVNARSSSPLVGTPTRLKSEPLAFAKPTRVSRSGFRFMDQQREGSSASVVTSERHKYDTAGKVSFTKKLRLDAIMKFLKEKGGVFCTGKELLKSVEQRTNSKGMDRKTVLGDLRSLEAQEKITVERVAHKFSTGLLFYLPEVTPTAAQREALITKNLWYDPNSKVMEKLEPVTRSLRLYSITSTKRKDKKRSAKAKAAAENADDSQHKEKPFRRSKATPSKQKPAGALSSKAKKNNIEEDEEARAERARQFVLETSKEASMNKPKVRKYRLKDRTSISRDDAVTIIRSCIITRCLNKENVYRFDLIAKYLNNPELPEEVIRRKWPNIRSGMGTQVFRLMNSAWRKAFLKCTRQGIITLKHLEKPDLKFFLKIWQENDIDNYDKRGKERGLRGLNSELEKRVRFNVNSEMNLQKYIFANTIEMRDKEGFFSYEQSLIQRENALLKNSFTILDEDVEFENYAEIKQTLKAILLSDPATYAPQDVKKLITRRGFTEEHAQLAIKEMESNKDIYAMMVHGKPRLFVNSKLFQPIPSVYSSDFTSTSSKYQQLLSSIQGSHKGVFLSLVIPDGLSPVILNNFAAERVKLLRLGKSMESFSYTYAIKNVNDKFFETRFILAVKDKVIPVLPGVPVPAGPSCSKIWIDVNGNINKDVFIRIVLLIISLALFRPGISKMRAYFKVRRLLSLDEFNEVYDWLLKKRCLKIGNFDSLYTSKEWYSVLG